MSVINGFSKEKDEKLWGKNSFIYSKRGLSFHKSSRKRVNFPMEIFGISRRNRESQTLDAE